MSRALRRRYGHAARLAVGDSARMVGPGGSIMGVVRARTPQRVWVWTGTTGFGQRRWPFDAKGRPVGHTKIAFPDLRLDVAYEDPFRPAGT